jgi:hypothetical protein
MLAIVLCLCIIIDVSDAGSVVAATINLVLFATILVLDYTSSVFLLAQVCLLPSLVVVVV